MKRRTFSTKLAELDNLGPVSAGWLNAVGVSTRADLAGLGAIEVYRLLKGHGYPATLNLVYAIDSALRGRDWRELPVARKHELRAAAADAVKPLAGALVKAFNKTDPSQPIEARTDGDGRAMFTLARPGAWLVSAVHMIPAPLLSGADRRSWWASVTFEIKK